MPWEISVEYDWTHINIYVDVNLKYNLLYTYLNTWAEYL